MSGDVVAKSVLTQNEAQLDTLRTQLAAAEAAAKEATQALEAAPEAAEEKVEAFESKALKAESERSAAEAALAQCVREYAKERAQKARLQQQISALQKRLLQTQITELQNTVLIGGRQIDPSASPSLASAAAEDDLLTPGAAEDAPPTEKLRAERRKTDRLDGRVRALTGRVHELQAELAQVRRCHCRHRLLLHHRSTAPQLTTLLSPLSLPRAEPPRPPAFDGEQLRSIGILAAPHASQRRIAGGGGGGGGRLRRRRRRRRCRVGACATKGAPQCRFGAPPSERSGVAVRRGL